MKIKRLHPWDVTPAEAAKIQEELKNHVALTRHLGKIERVAGVDVHYKKNTDQAIGAAVVLSFPALEILEAEIFEGKVSFPYIPGLLSFREIPLLIPALERLKTQPQVLMADGQGIAHPGRFGLASHLGILLGIPTIGCAKSRFIGTYHPPHREKEDYTYLYDNGEIIGAVVRTRTCAAPLYVSIGHQISLSQAVELVLQCTTRYRQPEPLRSAHRAAAQPA